MSTDKIIKISALNITIAVLNVLFFSNGLLDIDIGTSAFETAFGVTDILMSFLIFGFGNYQLLTSKKAALPNKSIQTPQECIQALREYHATKTFSKDIAMILTQTERFKKKKITVNDILLQKFSMGEMSYSKFEGAVLDLENVFYTNIKSILNRLNAFDEEDYNRMRNINEQKNFSTEFIQTKMGIYNEYIVFVKEAIEDNEQILLKLDKLLLEISKFNSLEDGEIENMSAMKEIDELIGKTKFYK
ncbi:MAG: hypothetical protein H7X94_11285 [Vallitaleaceae bacterium]|nr:hypothetical protein [Vallitaleaceae bacterium]